MHYINTHTHSIAHLLQTQYHAKMHNLTPWLMQSLNPTTDIKTAREGSIKQLK